MKKIKNDPNSQRLVKDQADHWALIVALKNQIDYTDGKKLACLMSLLRGDALESVNACDNIDQNYQPVLNQLMQELGDKNALIDEHISRASTSASTTQRHPPTSASRSSSCSRSKSSRTWTRRFREWLQRGSGVAGTPRDANNSATRYPVAARWPCSFCKEIHYPSHCTLSMRAKLEIVQWDRLCKKYLRPHLGDCRNPKGGCRNCNKPDHHTALCEAPVATNANARSIVSNKHLLNYHLTVTGLDLLAITENWLNDEIGDVILRDVCWLFCNPLPRASGRRGGVAQLFRDSIRVNYLPIDFTPALSCCFWWA